MVTPATWWRVPGEDGVLVHSLSWAPMLLDYTAILDHDTSTLDQWTLDGDYLYKNLDHIDRIHVVQDSDELFLASWAPLSEQPIEKRKVSIFGYRLARVQFGSSFNSSYFDPLKRSVFFLPVRWHSRPINAKWGSIEKKAARQLRRYVHPNGEYRNSPQWRLVEATSRVSNWLLGYLLGLSRLAIVLWVHRDSVWRHFVKMLRGDLAAMRQTFSFLRLFVFNGSARVEGTSSPSATGPDSSDVFRRIDEKSVLGQS
jgi:hypothetical protein